jgi:hypothetical protein
MMLFAEAYVLKVDLPFSEYWLPLMIGMGVGVCALTMGKATFGKLGIGHKKEVPAPPLVTKVDSDPFMQGSPSEQRKSFRRHGNPTGVFIALPEQKNDPLQGWVLDRSIGGICLQSGEEFKTGTQLCVLPVNAPPMTPWVDIEVRTCRSIKSGYEVGCQFLKTPNWSILLMFG